MSDLVSVLVSLAVGLVASLLWLLVLFSIKPHLEVEVKCRLLKKQPTAGWAFAVTNKSRVSAVQLQARLWHVVPAAAGFPARHRIALKNEELFQLNGVWAARRRTGEQRTDRTGDNRFRFLTDPVDIRLEDRLGDDDRLLFQVWAQHGFTNFGRVETLVIKKAVLVELLNSQKKSTSG
jgi:hypothetical protein